MYQQPKRYKKAFPYLFEEEEKFYYVLKVEDNIFVTDHKSVCCFQGFFEKWFKSIEDRLGYKIKIYGNGTASLILRTDKLYKIVKTGFKLKELNKDFEKGENTNDNL